MCIHKSGWTCKNANYFDFKTREVLGDTPGSRQARCSRKDRDGWIWCTFWWSKWMILSSGTPATDLAVRFCGKTYFVGFMLRLVKFEACGLEAERCCHCRTQSCAEQQHNARGRSWQRHSPWAMEPSISIWAELQKAVEMKEWVEIKSFFPMK